ncbi:ABC transporter ATP-binding protein [Paraflavisolibacter sp. H34]|uniref:ABC transporter ATP-binding protein n=1 Tax=Huijunlia imazamoxiresistens TaxID=3127457 RepID=UPI00301AEEBF
MNPPPTPPFVLEVHAASQKYRDNKNRPVPILDNINLRIREGEFVTVVGPTGCGKSTLLRMLLGSEKPQSGSVLMDRKEIEKPDRSRGIVFQRYSLFDNLTVKENVMLGLEMENFSLLQNLFHKVFHSSRIGDYKKLTEEYLERVGLAAHGQKYPYQLSGGMRQRVAIAQAMIMKPKVLLMDEPFGALDIATREEMHQFLIEQWKASGQTILFVTHDLDEAVYLGTRVIVLSHYYSGARGARIVKDIAVPWEHPRPLSLKESDAFQELVKSLKKKGLDAKSILQPHQFELSHRDACRQAV